MNFQSGKYIKLTKNEGLKSLSQKYSTSTWKLRELNKGKSFKKGDWILIPENKGILTRSRNPASYTPGVYDQFFTESGYIWPVPSSKRISSDYGHRWGRKHEGIDIPGAKGSKVVATKNGVVVYSGNEYTGYGNIVVIAHEGGIFSMYAHNKRNNVQKGQAVMQGQTIAFLGNTGRSTGAHVHFEIRKNSSSLNPNQLVARK